MLRLRPWLHVLAGAWVVFQALSLSVLVAPWCCIGVHGSEMSASAAPCPMHAEQPAAHHHGGTTEDKTPAPECAMRAACGGQAAALFAALSYVGVLQDSYILADSYSATPVPRSPSPLVPQFSSPDAPPPRS